jgi:hypothetical protein
MTFLLLLPTILASLIMAAHFLRAAGDPRIQGASLLILLDYVLLILALALPLLLLIPARLVRRIMQVYLTLAALDLLWTGYDIVQQRRASGDPDVVAPGVIMACVAAFCLLAATLYQTPRLKARYAR